MNRLSRGSFQPIPYYPKSNTQLIRFIKKQLAPKEREVFDWLMDHISMNNRILSDSKYPLVKLIGVEFGWTHDRNIRTILRKFIALGILKKVNAHDYILSPWVANRVSILSKDAYGFRTIGLKAIHGKGYADWKKADDDKKKKFPLLRKSLQAAQFHVMKELANTQVDERDIEMNELRQMLIDERQKHDAHREEMREFMKEMMKELRKHDPEQAEKIHLQLIKGGKDD